MTIATTVFLVLSACLLGIAAILGVSRIAAGPTQLERSIAADLIVAVVVASLGLWTVWTNITTELLILVLLSMIGFSGAVAVARMVSDRIATTQRYANFIDDATENSDDQ